MHSDRQTVVIGLDGVPPWLLDRLIAEGRMPRFAELRQTGACGRIMSSPNIMTPSAWTSMVTGVNAGRHGLFDFIRYVPQTHSIAVPTSLDRKAGTIWELLGESGRESAILRFPMTFPARPMAGITISDYLSPSPFHPRFTWPGELRKEIVLKFGALGWVQEPMTGGLSSQRELSKFIRRIDLGIKRTFDLLDYALLQKRFSLIFAVVSHTDALLHRLVHVFAPERARGEFFDTLPRGASQAAAEVFSHIDLHLGNLIDRIGPDTDLILVSDHGLAPTQPGPQNLLRALLIELGHLGWEESPTAAAASGGGRLGRLKSALAALLPWQVKRLLKPITEDARAAGAEAEYLEPIRWDRTDAVVLAPNPATEIWLNLAERSPRGRVAVDERLALEAELRASLESAVNPVSDTPVISRIIARDECFHGPWAHRFGDLLAIFDQDHPCEELIAQDATGREVHVTTDSPGAQTASFAGHHEPWGFIAAHGPRVASGVTDIECNVEDVMPTLAYLLTGRIPERLDGRLIEPMIAPDILEGNRPQPGPPVPSPDDAGDYEYTDDERADVEKRLKDLGYL